jgi:hypothetical protein
MMNFIVKSGEVLKKDNLLQKIFWKTFCLFLGHTRVFDHWVTKKWICWRCKKEMAKGEIKRSH